MLSLTEQFEVQGPDNLVFGRGCVEGVGERVAKHGERVLVVTDPGIREAGLLDGVLNTLDEAELTVVVFDEVTPDPDADVIRQCTERAIECGANAIVGVGGGSPMDVAKAAAIFAGSEKSLDELYGRGHVDNRGLPTVLIPTTSGTGSEVSSAIVLYDDHGEKQAIIDARVYAYTALVDPNLSMHLPPNLTRATGLDAFSHAMGSYVSTTTNTYADALAAKAMELIENHVREAVYHGSDAPAAREKMALAATMAMLGRVNGGKAAIHSVAYGLQEMYDLPHGEAIAMVLPEVIEYNLPAATEKLARLGEQMYGATGTDRGKAQTVVDGVYELRRDVGLNQSLRSVGAKEADMERLAEFAVHSERHLEANPRDMTQSDARELLEGLW